MKVNLTKKQIIISILVLGIILFVLGCVFKVFDNNESKISEVSTTKLKTETLISNSDNLENLEQGKVIVKYVDVEGNVIASNDEKTGYLGEEYSIERKEIPGYIAYGTEPINKTGNYVVENQEVTFIYQDALNAVNVDNENKDVTVTILNDKKITEYNVKIITKTTAENADILSGAGYKVTKGEEVIRSGIGYGKSFVIGTISITEEGRDTYTIEQTNAPNEYNIITKTNSINIVKKLNSETDLYEATIEYDTNSEVLNAYITDSNEIIIEIKNQPKEYSNIIIKYVDESGNEIANKEEFRKEIGTAYTYPETGKEIQGYTFKEVQGNTTGTYTKEDITITYVYKKVIEYGNIIIKYVDANGQEISAYESARGVVGTVYSFNQTGKDIEGYDFKEVQGNITGTYTKEDITITYVYTKKIEYGKVIFNYINEQGEKIAENETNIGIVGNSYSFSAKGKEIDKYIFKEVQGNITGTYTKEDITITYVYVKKEEYGKIILKYVDEQGENIIDNEENTGIIGTEYSFNATGKEIQGYDFKEVQGSITGTYTEEDITITYVYEKKAEYGKVILKYVDEEGKNIIDTEENTDVVGTEYSFSAIGKEIEGYAFKEVQGRVTGTYAKEDTTITYIYEKIIEYGTVILKYINEQSEEISENETITGVVGTEYSFNTTGKEIEGYTFKEVQGRVTGTYAKEDVTIIYVYSKDEKTFDLEINKYIKQITIKENNIETNKEVAKNAQLYKIEIAAKKLETTTIEVEYEIVIKNVGNISGYAKKITDFIPENMEYIETENVKWEKNNNTLTTNNYEDVLLNPGDSLTIPIKLSLKTSTTNIGTKTNNAEITLYYNEENLKDATPDNISSASLIVSVKTGIVSNTLIVIGNILICTTIAVMIIEKRNKK